jgi:Zn-dependent protease with chaperone function
MLGALGLALSRLVPPVLARARWTAREPGAAVLLWQAVALASVLCAVGVVLAGPEEVVRARGVAPAGAAWVLTGALAVAALIVGRLLLSLLAVSRRSRARRERHRTLVDLLDRAADHPQLHRAQGAGDAAGAGAVRVLDGPVPFAYCLPGRSPRVVLSGGALEALAAEEVAAVLAHERAHLRARHDLVLEGFTALHRAVPAPLRSRTGLDAVHLLLEVLADDAARRRHGAAPLLGALATMGGAARGVDEVVGDVAGGARDAGAELRARMARLAPGAPGGSPGLRAAAVAAAAGVLVLPTVVLVVPWLARALPAWPF